MTGQILAKLLHNPVCRELIEGGYRSVAEATADDPDVPTLRPPAAKVRNALNKLELTSVATVRASGYWTVHEASKLSEILQLTRRLPGKLATLENLAHPVGWSVIARLALGPTTRDNLYVCGASPRITEQVKALRRSNAILDRGELITLVEPAAHREVQDALEHVAQSIAFVDSLYAKCCIQAPQLRVHVGAHYCAGPDDRGGSRRIFTSNADFAGWPA